MDFWAFSDDINTYLQVHYFFIRTNYTYLSGNFVMPKELINSCTGSIFFLICFEIFKCLRPVMKEKDDKTIFPIDPDRMLKLVLDSIPTATFWKNKDSVYLGCNTEFARDAGGNSPSDIVGKTDYQLAWKKEEADFFVKIDKKVMESGKPKLNIVEPQRQADGKQSWLETNKVPLYDEQGSIIGILGTYNDVSDKVHALGQLRNYAENLESKNQELEQFAFIAAHDLQEPLKTMSSYIRYFEEEFLPKLDDDAAVIIKQIKASSERMQRLISGLLEYAQIGRNIEMSSVDTQEVVKDVLADLHDIIDRNQAQIDLGTLPVVYADKQELKSVFLNLIGNALKFQRKGNNPKISIQCLDNKDQWLFFVQDNGIGIDEKYREKVFTIYQKLNKHSEFTGEGVGLTHCKKIIESFGGKIWIESAPGGGSTMKFKLPKHES